MFDSGVLKSPTMILFLSISFLKSSKIFFIWALLCWVHIYFIPILGCGLCWLCVCLWFLVVFGSFFGGCFPPAGYLRVILSPSSCFLLCRCGKVVLELVLLCVQGFEAFLLLLFSCLFLVISSLFGCISK